MRISAKRVSELLAGGGELALLDVREQGVHYRGHPFFACAAPLSRLELVIADLVPRKGAPVVVLDGGEDDEGLAEKAAKKLSELGYWDVSILDGGCAGWKAAGLELFSGVNVPSKAFGEFVEHHYGTPRIPPAELKRLQALKQVVIVDSRPFEEYRRMSIPGGIDVPGAELAWRIHDLAPKPDTVVVVNCAGRTRSIIGCQSLLNAGIPNPVVALKDGTMGWDLAGLECERGAERVAPPPSKEGRAKALAAAERVAKRFGVRFCSSENLGIWKRDRAPHALHPRRAHARGVRAGARRRLAPRAGRPAGAGERRVRRRAQRARGAGGSRAGARGDDRVVAHADELARGLRARGRRAHRERPAPAADPGLAGLADRLRDSRGRGGARPLDQPALPPRAHSGGVVGRSFEAGRGARRDRTPSKLVLTSEDSILAHLAAPEAAELWPRAEIRVLEGGNAAWKGPTESGTERATTTRDDVWYKPYDHASDYKKHARDYLEWEVALVEQIKRDPTIRFRAFT